jgi:hypothetical protein
MMMTPPQGRPWESAAGRRADSRRERPEGATEDTHGRPPEGAPTGATEIVAEAQGASRASDREPSAVAGSYAPDGGGGRQVRLRPDADACGALGCVRADGLVLVERGGSQRVLCAYHARRWSG